VSPRSDLEQRLNYKFTSKALLDNALTHASVQGQEQNERLEFLGDRVLGLVIAALLYKTFPDEAEGDLAKRHTGLVQQRALAEIAAGLDLSAHIILSGGERNAGGAQKDAILADAVEALIGAAFLDGGYAAAEKMVTTLWSPHLHRQTAPPEDPKTKLQEWAQQQGLPLPVYELAAQAGPDHAPIFTVVVSVEGQGKAQAEAASKRAAEKLAARVLLDQIGNK
jgi:ribonuclease III